MRPWPLRGPLLPRPKGASALLLSRHGGFGGARDMASRPARVSPKIRHKEALRRRGVVEPRKGEWPVELLRAAKGAAGTDSTRMPPLPVEGIVGLLDEFVAIMGRSGQVQEAEVARFMHAHGPLRPVHLTALADVLLRDRLNGMSVLTAANLLKTASRLGDDAASMALVEAELKRSQSVERTPAREAVQRMAEMEDKADAMYLMAMIYEKEGSKEKSLDMARAAGERGLRSSLKPEDVPASSARAWEMLARAFEESGDSEGEQDALEIAALKCDSPGAYYKLAKKFRDPEDPEYLKFLLKAAASGTAPAAFEVGEWYLLRAEEARAGRDFEALKRDAAAMMKALLAEEWFTVSINLAGARSRSFYEFCVSAVKGDFGECHSRLSDSSGDEPWRQRFQNWVAQRKNEDTATLNIQLAEKARSELSSSAA